MLLYIVCATTDKVHCVKTHHRIFSIFNSQSTDLQCLVFVVSTFTVSAETSSISVLWPTWALQPVCCSSVCHSWTVTTGANRRWIIRFGDKGSVSNNTFHASSLDNTISRPLTLKNMWNLKRKVFIAESKSSISQAE